MAYDAGLSPVIEDNDSPNAPAFPTAWRLQSNSRLGSIVFPIGHRLNPGQAS